MAIKAKFTAGLLSVIGDNVDDTIAITRDATGQILVNGGTIVPLRRPADTHQHHTESMVFGGNGNDTISLDNIAPPAGQRCPPHSCSAATATTPSHGGAGNDTLNGGALAATTLRRRAVKATTCVPRRRQRHVHLESGRRQ